MVMHARKLPRIDDGYPDNREAQSYQSSQYPSSTGYGNHSDRYDRHRSPGRKSPSSRNSPRYIHKTSYIERAKEKYERGSTSSPGKKSNHSYVGGGSHSNNGNHASIHDRAPRANSSTVVEDKNDVTKSAVRTSGDWSEHLSSSGKIYYYNCKTLISQWEKPREWVDRSPNRTDRYSSDSRTSGERHIVKDGKKNRHSSGTIEKREKHLGDLRHMVADGNPKPDKLYLLEKLQQSQSKMQAERQQANNANRSHPSSDVKELHRRTDEHSSNDYSNSSSRRSRRDSDGARIGRQVSRQDDDVDSPGSTPTSHLSGGTPSGGFSSGTPVSNIGTSNLNISIPGLINQLGAGQNNQELTNKARQTLQKLQQALSRQIAVHLSSVANQNVNSSSAAVQASPHHHHPHHHQQHHQLSEDSLLLHHHQKAHHLHDHHQQLQSHPHHHHHHHQQQQQLQLQHQQLHPKSLVPPQHSQSVHRSPYMNSQSQGLGLSAAHSSPQPIVTVAASSPLTMTTTGSTTIPITHTGGQFPKGNTVYGKVLGSQTSRNCTSNYLSSHCVDELGGIENKVIDGGGGGGAGPGGGGGISLPSGGGANISDRSSCCSPAPSDTSSQGAPVDPDMFTSPVTSQKENNLMASLSQYYNEKLVSHVTGWPAEQVDRQARLYGEESLKLGSLVSSQVSVELKRARSLVRVEEIQATLQEQKNLFLAQQIAELENMRPVSSVSSFLPSSSTSAAATTS